MRTTATIEDGIPAIAGALARQNRFSLGRALSKVAGRGQRATVDAGDGGGLPVFPVPCDAKPVTGDDVFKALGDWP